MHRSLLRLGGTMAVAAALGTGAVAALHRPADAQSTTCYAIVCNGTGTCSVIEIECPKPIVPVKPKEPVVPA